MIRIDVTDLEQGETETQTITDDVVVIVAGRHYVASVQKYPSTGTQVWTIKTDEDDHGTAEDDHGEQHDGPTTIGDHASQRDGVFFQRTTSADTSAVRKSPFSDECSCGRVWEGHPNPHAITCPLHGVDR